MKSTLFYVSFCLITLFGFAFNAQAQIAIGASKVSVTPQYPKANEQVTVTLEDYTTNLDSQTITWSVNGGQKQSGVGLKTYSFKLGALGTSAKVTISTASKTYSKTIIPSEIDMIWDATDSYTPPFYEGKALYPNQGTITIAAIPNMYASDGSKLDQSKLIYKWKKDGFVVQDQSGYGKNIMRIKGSVLAKPVKYEVEISSTNGAYMGYGEITVNETRPFISFYEDDPLFGIKFNKKLNDQNLDLEKNEIKINAIPYFFSPNPNGQPLEFSWRVNNQAVPQNITNSIVLRKESDALGSSVVFASTKHRTNFMQSAQADLTVVLDE